MGTMFKSEKEYLGLTLTDVAFKAVRVKLLPQGQVFLIDAIKRDVRDVPPEELPKIVDSALAELGAKRIPAVCFIPLHLITTKNIEIPSLDPQEIRSIIDLQAGRHTPYAREEILVGYITVCVFQRNYTKVLLVIVNRGVVKKQTEVFDSVGVRIHSVLFPPEGIARFYAQALHVKPDDVPVGIIHFSQNATDFIVEFNTTVATCRNIPIGLSHLIKEGDTAKEGLIAELVKSLEAYQSEDINRVPETYYLTSDDAKVKELQPILQDKLKANVKIMSYLDLIQAPQPIMLKLVSEYSDDSFLDILAVTPNLSSIQVDLTPEEVKTQRVMEEKGREVVKAGVMIFIVLLFTTAMFFSKISFRSNLLGQLKEDYVVKHRAVISLDRVAQRNRVVKNFVSSRMTTLEIINNLYQLIPQEIYLENILIEEDVTITIRGVSESMSRVFNFVTALEESELFKNVKTKSTTAKKDRGKDAAAFEIAFRLESSPDAPEGAPAAGEEAPAATPAAAETKP